MALALFLLGCGSQGGIDKAEFIREGNAICKKTIETLTEEGRETFSEAELEHTNVAGVPFIVGVLIPEFRAEVRHLRELGAPAGEEERIDAILRSINGVIAEAKADPNEFLHEAVNRYEKPQALATKYGLNECPTTRYTLW